MSNYIIKIKNKNFTIPKENLKLLAMTKGIFAQTDEEIIEKFRQNGCEIEECNDDKNYKN